MSEVTRVLIAIEQGDPSAAGQLLPLVYDELRRLAVHRLAEEKSAQTLQATALVHEAYPRLVDTGAMRRILVKNARKRGSSNEVPAISHRYQMPRPVGRKREMRCLANAPALG